jgi:cation diffusion facilitator family transporter
MDSHKHNLSHWRHEHDFLHFNAKGERRTRLVLVLTALTMMVEIAAGLSFNSMALLADGWHMGTHVAAFMITIFAYRYSRIHAHDQTFAFSPAKVGVLGGFASSIALAVVAVIMFIESIQRFLDPFDIRFDEAILVASFGLLINVISAILLKDDHDHHGHDHASAHDHKPGKVYHHHDHNLKAAYLHVLADALTSILAIIALVAGKYYGWVGLDPLMGLVGAAVILVWAYSLIKETGPVLVDESIDDAYKRKVIETIERKAGNRVTDLHVWRMSSGHYAMVMAIVTRYPKSPSYYKKLLSKFHKLDHMTIEINLCKGDQCLPD